MKFTQVGFPPTGCPIIGSNKLPVQRQTDRQTDRRTKSLDLRAEWLLKKCFFFILTSKKFAVQIKHAQSKCVIIQSFRSKKLPKILEIQALIVLEYRWVEQTNFHNLVRGILPIET